MMSPTGRYVDHNESTSVYPVLVSRNLSWVPEYTLVASSFTTPNIQT